MYKTDYFYVMGTFSGTQFEEGFKEWLATVGDVMVISHAITVDTDGDHIVTIIYKG